ncbi:hypothetical protein [uncultured Prevotella sp.]|uniref:hypothetical protein n=1 Tax=uncultured Prevotella sp. TaxID=159272 RepID=UPI00258CE907|nr:hypothetical protein [uncultured Prevotella sp.]
MKRIIIMLFIACSAVVTATAQSKSKIQKKDYLAIVENKEYQYPLRVFRRLREIRDQFGRKQGQVYSVLKNPNTGLIESAERITHFSCDVKELKTIDQVFMDDEPYSYQILHIMPGSREQFSIRVVSNGGQPNNTLHVRTNSKQEMWFLATKNLDNPQLRDAYAIVWEPSADGLNVEGTVYGISSLRPDLYTKNLETSNNVFRIDGRVGDDLTDSLYVVYMADSSEELDKLADDAFMEYMPVVNRRFSFSVEIDKPKVGRIRTVMPDGSLCHLWTNLDFVPGETYHITTHNGYYDEDRDYERRVGRYSGKSLLNKRQVRGIDDVANVDDADDASAHDRPFPEPSPALKLRMEIKYKELGAKTETVRAFYKSLDPKRIASWARKDRIFDRIIKQNQEVDAVFRDLQKLFKDYFKEFDNLVDKRAEILGPGYEGILEFYTEQNKALTEMISSGIQLPKSAQKTQKALNKYIEKYMKEMTKLAMEVE